MNSPTMAETDRPTDHYNIDLNRLHWDVAFGRAGGKIIWQPCIGAWYSDKMFAGQSLPAPYTGMSKPELYRALGCSARVYEYSSAYTCREDPAVRLSRKHLNATDYELCWETPIGSQRAVYRVHKESPWHEPVKWPIADERDMQIAAWRMERNAWHWDQATFEEVAAQWSGLGAPTMLLTLRTTIQRLYVEDMGVGPAIYALQDYPATCERYFEALTMSQERLIDVINASPIDIINFGDNLASSTSPALFKKYILPVYQKNCASLHAAGKFISSHWDGACKPLLPYAKETGLDGIEAITPLPQGDVTLEETKQALGDMFLLDGIPAVFFDRVYNEQTLIDCAKKCIDLFAPRLILGASDEVAAHGDIERVRLVGRIVDDYNASL